MLNGAHNVMFTLVLGVATGWKILQRSMVLGFFWTLGMAGFASWSALLLYFIFFNGYSHLFPQFFLHICFDDVLRIIGL